MKSRLTRRKFLKSTAAGTAAAAGGMAGILATGRAPAIAQATEVHWLRWNDFVPTCDKILREKLIPEAEKALAQYLKQKRISETGVAQVYAALGEKDKAFERLEKAYADRTIGVGSTPKTDPSFDPLRSDPRFASLLRRMNLEP